MGSAFRGGPGLGEFLNESPALSGMAGVAWENLLNSSSVRAESLGTSRSPRENKVSDPLWTHFHYLTGQLFKSFDSSIRQTSSNSLSAAC